MTLDEFLAGTAPIGVLAGSARDAAAIRFRAPGYAVREVRGAKMPTVAAVFDEFAAAFQFPYYFGQNKDAFDECMRELEFVAPGAGYVVVVRDADELLAAQPDQRGWFDDAMRFYAEHWAQEATVFRVILQSPDPLALGGDIVEIDV